jgi:hypothetical protein
MAQAYDKILKENLEKIILQLIRKTTGIDPVKGEILYPELQYTLEREADFVEKVTTRDNQSLIFHIEFQTTNEKAMADRMFVYAGLIYQIYHLPVRQIVFYIGKEPMKMINTLKMPTYEYNYELINLQQVSYKQFIDSHIPEEVLLAILCNFGKVKAEMVVEEIFTKLRMLQDSDLNFQKSVKQLSVLSLLRDLQPLIIERIQAMALTLDITKDFFYQQGEKKGEKRKALEVATNMLEEGLATEMISRFTKLSAKEIEELRQKIQAKNKKP